MGLTCFVKMDTNPPICGVHKTRIVLRTFPIDEFSAHPKSITCYVCPISEEVLSDTSSLNSSESLRLRRHGS